MGVPYVVHLHGIDYREFWSSTHPLVARAIDRLFNHSRRIIVMGRFWADVITDRLPQVAGKIVIIPNATPTSASSHAPATDRRVRITFLGKLGARKGSPHLIAALGRLANRRDWTATIAGDGEISETRESVHRHLIGDRVTVPGWLELRERDKLLCTTDILVLPSLAENLPMVIVEAFARGIPVISTPVGAIPEVIENGRNGILVPVGDEGKLAEALEGLIEDPASRERLGQAARRDHSKFYDFDVYIRRLTETWLESLPPHAN
jgi:glycosyltransferase involved in cell wall biosynthesis